MTLTQEQKEQERKEWTNHFKAVEKMHELEDFFFEEFGNHYCKFNVGDDENWRGVLWEYLWSDDDYLATCPDDDVEESKTEEGKRVASFLKENVFGKMGKNFIQYKIDEYRSLANFLDTYKHYGYED
jgi:hypothetical protein